MMTHCTDDVIWDVPSVPPVLEGKEAVKADFEELFQGLPDFATTEGLILLSGNIVVVEHLFIGTHQGLFMDIPATGKSLRVPHMDIYEFEGDKIKKITTYMDNVGIMVQLGLMPAPESIELVPSFELPDPEATGLSPVEASVEKMNHWNARDLAGVAKFMALDDQIFIAPLGATINRDAYIASQELGYFVAFSDIQVEILRSIGLGEGWVLHEVVYRGTHDGPYFGIPATGRSIEIRAVLLYHFNEDGIETDVHVYFDNLSVLMQLGVVEPPTTSVLPTTWGQVKSFFQE
jgi:steroid delta-isomerase-like uncharacterized protein